MRPAGSGTKGSDDMDPLEQKRNGYSLADCAEIMAAMSALKTEHGEPGYQPHFQQFLRSKGLTESAWATVWNDWHKVTEADPALGAKFHTYMAQVQQRRLMAKQPDVSGEVIEGVSLATYAKISAQSQTGAAIEGLVAGEGLTMEQWQKGNAAWAAKMGSCSPTDPIMIQFGQLYQKWAPNHQAMMEATTQAALESSNAQGGMAGGFNKELDLDNAHEFWAHDDIRIRARGVREAIRIWELNWNDRDARMRKVTQQAYDEAIKILTQGPSGAGLMALNQPADQVDIHAWSKMVEEEQTQQGTSDLVHGSLKDLAGEKFMSAQQNEAAQNAIRQAITRLQPRSQKVNEIFAGVTDELKKVQVRSLIDDYRETLNDMQEGLDDWDYSEPEDEASSAPMAAGSSGMSAPAASTAITTSGDDGGGFLAMLKRLPIIGNILRMLGL